ncbi:MAG: crossover junction endodeoxyribonuclease RuvC [Elusimicrobia bacterium]|nr:crossover junction endodeoxyribonuclease RuvC [Elusimicrobiota bacterium]
MKKPDRVIGIDPGLDRTGWAVLEKHACADPVLASCGLIHTASGLPLPRRLELLFNELTAVIKEHAPESAAIEEMFFMKRSASASASVQARGVILLAAQTCGIEVCGYDPRTVKKNVSGSGAAEKPQMQRMVRLALRLEKELQPDDVSDAAALALCHLRMNAFKNLVQKGLAGTALRA